MYKLNLEKYLDDRFDKESNIKKRQKISEEVTTYYSNINDIVGIILVGSLQGAPRDKFSDFDFEGLSKIIFLIKLIYFIKNV